MAPETSRPMLSPPKTMEGLHPVSLMIGAASTAKA